MSEEILHKKSNSKSLGAVLLDGFLVALTATIVGGLLVYFVIPDMAEGMGASKRSGGHPMDGYGAAVEAVAVLLVSSVGIVILSLIACNFLWMVGELFIAVVKPSQQTTESLFSRFVQFSIKIIVRFTLSVFFTALMVAAFFAATANL